MSYPVTSLSPLSETALPSVAPQLHQNVNQSERSASLALGAGVLLGSIFGQGFGRLIAFGAAAGLIYRGMTGHCPLYEKLHVDTTTTEDKLAGSTTDFTGV
jgi:uncharacterized membrane protein